MDEKRIYQIYVGVMKLHKKYLGQQPDRAHLTNFVTDINAMNGVFNSNFCNAITDSLRRWYIDGFHGLGISDIASFYTDLWKFHKKYMSLEQTDNFWQSAVGEIRELDKKYSFQQFRWFTEAIMNEFELFEEDQAAKSN